MLYSKQDMRDMQDADTIADLPDKISEKGRLKSIHDVEIPDALKDGVERRDLGHRDFEKAEFWKKIPYFSGVSAEDFMDPAFQNSNTVTKLTQLEELLEHIVAPSFLQDVKEGMRATPMNMRLSPYIMGLINWDDPYNDPLRIQFIPVSSSYREDHPKLSLDSLHEQADSPTEGLVHRYFDKALFLPLDVCPVYCRFCTRSYAIGSDTDLVSKYSFKAVPDKWNKAFAYIASRPEIEDVVISGGDTYMLSADRLRQIGIMLLDIPHVRRIRFATKGPAVMPMKILRDDAWRQAIVDTVNRGREMGKEVVLHTHFNSPNEITDISRQAMDAFFSEGVTVRNQSVLLRGVNDNVDTMTHLVRKLSYMNVQPYYIYQHDMVKGVEELRTKLEDSIELELSIRGTTAGFNTPLFVMDAPGGGGKRDLHSYDHYDPITGISVYRSPSVHEDRVYLYFDPIHLLPEEGQRLWADQSAQDRIIQDALKASGNADLKPVL